MVLGIIFSFIVSILFAIYAAPRKFSKQNAVLYTMWTGLAYFAGACLVCLVVVVFGLYEIDLLNPWNLLSVLRGFIWVLGTVAFNLAIDKIGLARFNQWKNLQGPIGTALMLVFLTDVAGEKILFVIAGMTVMFISAVMFTIGKEGDDKKSTMRGVLLAVFAALCFGVTAFINKLVTLQGLIYSQLLFHSLSVTVCALVIYLITERKPKELFRIDKSTWLPVMTGLMFLVATLLSIFAYTMISGSVSWSIVQLNCMWTFLVGVLIFKEISFRRNWARITAGFIFAAGALCLLFFAL